MAVLQRKCGEQIVITPTLHIFVLAINECGARFSVCDAHLRMPGAALSQQIADVCRNRSCYFWFPPGGCCSLIVSCAKGQSILLVGDIRLTVVDVAAGYLTAKIAGLPKAKKLTIENRLNSLKNRATALVPPSPADTDSSIGWKLKTRGCLNPRVRLACGEQSLDI